MFKWSTVWAGWRTCAASQLVLFYGVRLRWHRDCYNAMTGPPSQAGPPDVCMRGILYSESTLECKGHFLSKLSIRLQVWCTRGSMVCVHLSIFCHLVSIWIILSTFHSDVIDFFTLYSWELKINWSCFPPASLKCIPGIFFFLIIALRFVSPCKIRIIRFISNFLLIRTRPFKWSWRMEILENFLCFVELKSCF